MRSACFDKKKFYDAVSLFQTELEGTKCALKSYSESFFDAFVARFHPRKKDSANYLILAKNCSSFERAFLENCVKTNFFCAKKRAIAFRFLPSIFAEVKFAFSRLPYALFFIAGDNFFGFHIRFRDHSRGGFRTVLEKRTEKNDGRKEALLSECYELALLQDIKNKDIPEGGSKASLFVGKYKNPLVAQKDFIEALLSLVAFPHSCEIVDYYKRQELLYLGPDENLSDEMIEWMAKKSESIRYPPKRAFISGKKTAGIHHKKYGVTSWGLLACLERVLRYLKIDPFKKPFTISMTGGPDGDVGGNLILNLALFYPESAKVVAIVDISGLLYDPEGLDFLQLSKLVDEKKTVKFYPLRSVSAFFFDRNTHLLHQMGKRAKKLTDVAAADLLHKFIHRTKVDFFIPCGGPPHALKSENVSCCFDKKGRPFFRAIIEGANIYLSQSARSILEKKKVLIIKDSTANKGGVIASSWEVLAELVLTDAEFMQYKPKLIAEILNRIWVAVTQEVDTILWQHKKSGRPCSQLSDELSARMQRRVCEIQKRLPKKLTQKEKKLFLEYCLPVLTKNFTSRLLKKIPENHMRASIATLLANRAIYRF